MVTAVAMLAAENIWFFPPIGEDMENEGVPIQKGLDLCASNFSNLCMITFYIYYGYIVCILYILCIYIILCYID